MIEPKKHASLFTGIGGFDLAAEWMGWDNIFQCEVDSYCNKLLKQNFPNTIKHGDIKETDFTIYRGIIDVLSGGFPCQPYSTAGKRLGKEDNRHLWPEMLRAIREVQPPWVVGENVRGLTNWNGGLVFDEVQSDLEAEGYEVTPFLLPAAGVNAPHRRERIWFIAYACGYGHESREPEKDRCTKSQSEIERHQWEWIRTDARRTREQGFITYTDNKGSQRNVCGQFNNIPEESDSLTGSADNRAPSANQRWNKFPIKSPICGRDDGISNRVDRIKGLGNAVVPQVVLQIFKAIEAYEKHIVDE